MTAEPTVGLELDDVQAGAIQSRPTPYAGAYIGLRIDDRYAGRELLRRLIPILDSAADFHPDRQVSLAVALTFPGLEALGVPSESLASFPAEFQQGMAARADFLVDVGENAPENWEQPFGTGEIHMVIVGLAPSADVLQPARVLAEDAVRDLPRIVPVWREEVNLAADERNWFGFRDSISQPEVEGTGIAGTNPHEAPFKAGEFVLGYEDETGSAIVMPEPGVLGRNGTYVAFRKLHMRVAAFRQYLRDQAKDRADEEWLAAKVVGRWPSGAPLALCPHQDDPELGADPARNNAFVYGDDPDGLKTPPGCHARRANPRDARVTGAVRLHRMIRRGMNYGPPLPDGVLEDDGVDRGLIFAFVGAHLARQFEFVQKQWIADGKFIASPAEKDPLVAHNDGGQFTVPKQPIRRRVRAAGVRREPGRRVGLHAGPPRAAVAGRPRHVSPMTPSAREQHALDADVAIVGYGPVGQALSVLRASQGHRVCVIERYARLYPLPRAFRFDGEIMRIFQRLGIVDELRDELLAVDRYEWFGADGEPILDIDVTPPHASGWRSDYSVYQPAIERALDRAARSQPTHELRRSWACERLVLHDDRVALTIRRGSEPTPGHWVPSDEIATVVARYVVGTDGAHSIVRDASGIGHVDLGFSEDWLIVDVRPYDMARFDRLPVAAEYGDPRRPHIVVRNGPRHLRWEFMLPEGDDRSAFASDPSLAWSLIKDHITPDGELVRQTVYEFRSLVTETMRTGRALLAGDSAHLMPPFMGEGLCAGLHAVERFDDVIGAGFALVLAEGNPDKLLERDLIAYVTDELRGVVVSLDPSVSRGVKDADGALTAWLRENGAAAVLSRPDAYVFGSAPEPAGAAELVRALRRAINRPATDAPPIARAA